MKKILILLCLLSTVCLGHFTAYGLTALEQGDADGFSAASIEEYPGTKSTNLVAQQSAV